MRFAANCAKAYARASASASASAPTRRRFNHAACTRIEVRDGKIADVRRPCAVCAPLRRRALHRHGHAGDGEPDAPHAADQPPSPPDKVAPGLRPAPMALSRERAKAPYSAAEIASYLALVDAQPTSMRRHRASALVCLGAGGRPRRRRASPCARHRCGLPLRRAARRGHRPPSPRRPRSSHLPRTLAPSS